MESFINELSNFFDNYSYTENGALAYKSSGKELIDFSFKISYYRNHPEEIIADFDKLIGSDEPIETVARFLFYVGDIRNGLGERNTFKLCLERLLSHLSVERASQLIALIPEYNRWDSVWKSMWNNDKLFDKAMEIVSYQLISDVTNSYAGKPISLLAKWLPSENASSETTKEMARKIYKKLGLTSKKYRMILSSLRKYLNVVETKMSSNNWSEIDYEEVPSKANLNYANAFMKHDEERRDRYLQDLKQGKAKINSSTNYPYEILDKYDGGWGSIENIVYEEMWKALPKLNIKNTLVVRDGSGSMTSHVGNTTCLSVATSLAIYLSENNSGEWKDKFITFSNRPKFVDLSKCKTLLEKIKTARKETECANTDILKTMRLILNVAQKGKLLQEEMPEMILIISDMQFDEGSNINGTLFETIKQEYKDAGYSLPKICFWNVAGSYSNTVPLQENEYGLILCSGFSQNIVKMFLSDKIDPREVLLETLYSERYNPIGEVFKK